MMFNYYTPIPRSRLLISAPPSIINICHLMTKVTLDYILIAIVNICHMNDKNHHSLYW